MQKITVLVLEPNREPYVKEITRCLESYQEIVGGYIEIIYPFGKEAALVCNEDGKILWLPWNRALKDDNGEILDIVVGTCFITGLKGDDFSSLSQELVDKYTEMFKDCFWKEIFQKFE